MAVGVKVMVAVLVGEDVAVGGSRVAEAVGDASNVGVGVGVSSGGLFRGMKMKVRRRISPMMAGIPYLMNWGGRARRAFLYGATTGGLPVKPSGERSFLKLSGYSPTAKLTKLMVLRAKGTLVGVSMMGMIFLRRDNACVY